MDRQGHVFIYFASFKPFEGPSAMTFGQLFRHLDCNSVLLRELPLLRWQRSRKQIFDPCSIPSFIAILFKFWSFLSGANIVLLTRFWWQLGVVWLFRCPTFLRTCSLLPTSYTCVIVDILVSLIDGLQFINEGKMSWPRNSWKKIIVRK